jgi:hypothetical protein
LPVAPPPPIALKSSYLQRKQVRKRISCGGELFALWGYIDRLLLFHAKNLLKPAKDVRRAFSRLDTAPASCIRFPPTGAKGEGTMRGLLWCGLFCVLIGCADKAQLAAEDDAKCQSYGAKHSEPAYVQCRAQLDAARTQANATGYAAAIQPPPIYTPAQAPAFRPPPMLPPIPPPPLR